MFSPFSTGVVLCYRLFSVFKDSSGPCLCTWPSPSGSSPNLKRSWYPLQGWGESLLWWWASPLIVAAPPIIAIPCSVTTPNDWVCHLLEHCITQSGVTTFMFAAANGKTDVVTELVSLGANVNAQSNVCIINSQHTCTRGLQYLVCVCVCVCVCVSFITRNLRFPLLFLEQPKSNKRPFVKELDYYLPTVEKLSIFVCVYLILGAHAQRGLWYLVCVCVCVCLFQIICNLRLQGSQTAIPTISMLCRHRFKWGVFPKPSLLQR